MSIHVHAKKTNAKWVWRDFDDCESMRVGAAGTLEVGNDEGFVAIFASGEWRTAYRNGRGLEYERPETTGDQQ